MALQCTVAEAEGIVVIIPLLIAQLDIQQLILGAFLLALHAQEHTTMVPHVVQVQESVGE